MRIASGTTDQYIYFVAVDSTDLKSRETGLTGFTVYRSRNGGAAAAMTTPTVNETDATNMPGVYELLLDEDMSIDAGDDTQEMVFHITQASMAPVTRTIELYRPKITAGNTLDVTATGAAGIDWGNVENQSTSVNLSSTTTNLVNTTTTNTDMITAATVNAECDTALADYDPPTKAELDAGFAALNDINAAGVTAAVWDATQSSHTGAGTFGEIASETAAILVDTSSTIPASLATIDNNVDAILLDTQEIGVAGAGLTNLGGSGNNWNVGKTGYSLTPTTGLGNQTANITGSISSVTGNVDGNVTGSVGSNLELGPAEVNAEVSDVLKTDAISEMAQGAPTATPTFEEAVMYLYMALRNRLDVDTSGGTDYKEFYNDAGTVIWKKAVSDDGSTYTEAEGITGP